MRLHARKSSIKCLSVKVVTAKRLRRQLKRKRNHSEVDRYPCRHAIAHQRLALTRLRPQITESNNFIKLRSAYRQRHFTETTLLNILYDSYGNIDSSLSTLVCRI